MTLLALALLLALAGLLWLWARLTSWPVALGCLAVAVFLVLLANGLLGWR